MKKEMEIKKENHSVELSMMNKATKTKMDKIEHGLPCQILRR